MQNAQNEVSAFTVNVFLMAENRLLRKTLVRLFQKRAGISVVGESRYSESKLEHIAASQCSVLLLDSPTMAQTTSLIDGLGESAPVVNVVLFGMDEDFDLFLRAVRAGVRGYLLKDASSAEIISAVRGVAQGEGFCPPKALCAALPTRIARVPPEVWRGGPRGLRQLWSYLPATPVRGSCREGPNQ